MEAGFKLKGMTMEELIAWTPPAQSFILDKLIIPQGKIFIFGQSETWKSWMTMHLGFCLASGREFFGFKVTQKVGVYILQTENPQGAMRSRLIKYTVGNSVTSSQVWMASEMYIKLDKGWGYAALEEELRRTRPKVLIIDPAYCVMSGKITDVLDVTRFLDQVNMLCDRHKVAIIIVHHTRKPQMVEGVQVKQDINDLFGASQFRDWCDTALMLETTATDGEIIMSFQKHRHSEVELRPITVKIDRENAKFSLLNNPNNGHISLSV